MVKHHSFMKQVPEEYWPNVHDTDIWFIGELVKREEVKPMRGQPEEVETIGYSLTFNIDTVLAAYPEDAREGSPLVLLFMFEGNEAAIPIIQEMTAGKRYLIRGWEDPGFWSPRYGKTHTSLNSRSYRWMMEGFGIIPWRKMSRSISVPLKWLPSKIRSIY
jgi:hypothetical protein